MQRGDGYGSPELGGMDEPEQPTCYCQANLLCNADEFYCEGCKCMSCSVHGHCDYGGDPNCPWYIMGLAFNDSSEEKT